jgi:hypothetical protein
MTPRVWTKKELDIVHPLDGWTWVDDGVVYRRGQATQLWAAERIDEDDAVSRVAVLHTDDSLYCDADATPVDVILAVILVSKGRDSMKTISQEMDARADAAHDRVRRLSGDMCCVAEGEATAYEDAAATLRRGKVKP